MRRISFLLLVAVTCTPSFGASANNASELLQNHAPDSAPAPVYLGSRNQEAAYQDYLAQLTSQGSKKDKEMIGGPSTASAPKFDGQYGMPTPSPKKKHKKSKPSSTASPSMYADYGYADEDDVQHTKSYYAQPVKHKYAYADHKVSVSTLNPDIPESRISPIPRKSHSEWLMKSLGTHPPRGLGRLQRCGASSFSDFFRQPCSLPGRLPVCRLPENQAAGTLSGR